MGLRITQYVLYGVYLKKDSPYFDTLWDAYVEGDNIITVPDIYQGEYIAVGCPLAVSEEYGHIEYFSEDSHELPSEELRIKLSALLDRLGIDVPCSTFLITYYS
jgi:hypothetical protein